jgi:hypothetical protein
MDPNEILFQRFFFEKPPQKPYSNVQCVPFHVLYSTRLSCEQIEDSELQSYFLHRSGS